MKIENFIPLKTLVTHYKVELSFFSNLSELGLVEIQTVEQVHIYIKILFMKSKNDSMHQELDVNIEGIDVVLIYCKKIETLQKELVEVKNRLRLYEN
jgi:hypothetical protein